MPKSRLFLALVPEFDIKNMLTGAQDRLKVLLDAYYVRWEDPGKFHMTLRFLGDIDDNRIHPMGNVLDRIRFGFEELRFRTFEIGFFPNKKYPNVVYAGFKEQTSDSIELIGSIDSMMQNFGVKPDKRFVPHITLGRFDRSKRKKLEDKEMPVLPETEAVFESFSLMKSTLKQGGSEYSEIFKIYFFK